MNQFNHNDLEHKTIAVASGKGGVGKTWFSITLAHILSRMGRKVLLFDGDLGLANIDIQLGLMPDQDIGHVINGRQSLKDVTVRYEDDGFGAGGFDIIAGRSGSGTLSTLSLDFLRNLREELIAQSSAYDHLIIDLAAGVEPPIITLSDHKGPTLVLMTPDPTSLTDAYAFIKLRAMRNRDADLRIVVNMAQSKAQGNRAYNAMRKACENFLKISPPLAGIIPLDSRVTDAIRAQGPLLLRYPQSEAAESVASLARHLGRPQKALAG